MKAKVRKNINKYNAIKMTCKINQGMHLRGLFSCNADIKRALNPKFRMITPTTKTETPTKKASFCPSDVKKILCKMRNTAEPIISSMAITSVPVLTEQHNVRFDGIFGQFSSLPKSGTIYFLFTK